MPLADLPDLLTLSELADVFRSTAKNRHRAGRAIADRHQLPLIEGHRPGVWLVPAWAVSEVIGGPLQVTPTCCPTCGRDIGPDGCPDHPRTRHLEVAS